MAQIKFKMYYTDFVEHCLRKTVRYDYPSQDMPNDWFSFGKSWLDFLSERDRAFILFVFDKQFFNTIEGLYCFKGEEDMTIKREWPSALEKKFAIDGGLFSEVTDNINEHDKK